MKTDNRTLNPAQLAAVQNTDPVCVIAAGPGSGKTHVLVESIEAKVFRDCEPEQIVILTFTNAGAREIASRLAQRDIGGLGYVGTLHGWCFRLLQRHGALLGYVAGAITIADAAILESLTVDIIGKLGLTKIARKTLDAGITAEAKMLAAELRHTLKRSNIVNYDRILDDGLKLLGIKKVRDTLDIVELFVDEAQDGGGTDWAIYEAMPAKRKTIIGDPDQSMYGFRGARPDLFTRWASAHPTITLEWNYRSDVEICAAGNAIIAHNADRIAKRIVPTRSELGLVKAITFDSAEQERFEIGNLVEIKAVGMLYREVAVLARTNWLAAEIRDSLRARGGLVAGNERAAVPPDWPLVTTTIQAMLNPSNDVLVERWLQLTGSTRSSIAAIKKTALMGDKMLSSLIPSLPVAGKSVEHDVDRLARLISSESHALVEVRLDALPMANPTLHDLLHDLWRPDEWGERQAREGVTVTTIHGAKGREWDHVIVAGLEEGTLPLKSGEIEEERRIAFVAATRARHTLTLTHTRRRTRFFKTEECVPSRFLSEILP